MNSTLIKPIITEKSMRAAASGRFTFQVAVPATKDKIRKAVEDAFKVNVHKIQTLIVKGHAHRSSRRRLETITSSWKKAIVTLKPGEKIEYFDVTEEQNVKK